VSIVRTLAVIMIVALGASVSLDAQRLVVLVRHAERADSVPANGPMLSSVDPPLSPAGQARAVALADMLAEAGITTVYASEYKRAQDTARPLAARIGIPVQIAPSAAGRVLVGRIRSEHPDGVVFIVGHSNTLPEFMRAFGVRTPPAIGEDEYDKLFVVVPATGALLTLTFGPATPPDQTPRD
jgi:phosphohistidine phosphatase SixA